MRLQGRESTPLAVLSRSLAGTRGKVLIVNLPGSPKGAVESLDAIVELVPHVLELLRGQTDHVITGAACFDRFFSLFCAALLAAQQPQQPQPATAPPEANRPTIFRGGVEVVQAPVLVFDRDGNYVNGLQPHQFHLFDNGKEQNINVDVTYQPISLVIVLQANAHVEGILPQVKKIGNLIAPLMIGEQGEAAVIAFDSRIRTLQDFTSDQRQDHQGGEGSDGGQQFEPHDRRGGGGDARCCARGPPTGGASSCTSARRAIFRAKHGCAKR